MASQLFGFDVLSLTSEEFIPYHQLLWFMSAILPYEKHRIFGRVHHSPINSFLAFYCTF